MCVVLLFGSEDSRWICASVPAAQTTSSSPRLTSIKSGESSVFGGEPSGPHGHLVLTDASIVRGQKLDCPQTFGGEQIQPA